MTSVRDRHRPIKVFVSDEEREVIQQKAKESGSSASSYLRSAGLGMRLKSRVDHEALKAVLALHAELGREGGLLKQWLSHRLSDDYHFSKEDPPVKDIRAHLKRMESIQEAARLLVMNGFKIK